MAFDSFRDFIAAFDRAGELNRISSPVATELEITELADREMKSPKLVSSPPRPSVALSFGGNRIKRIRALHA